MRLLGYKGLRVLGSKKGPGPSEADLFRDLSVSFLQRSPYKGRLLRV